jgi:hypothetical protein
VSVVDLIGLGRDIGARFALVGLLPGLVLALFVLALLWSGAPGDAPDLALILDEARTLDAWAGAFLFLGLLVAAIVLQPLQLGLVRWLEGYWPRPLADRGRAKYERRVAALEATTAPRRKPLTAEELASMSEAAAELRLLPPREHVMPTRLGNALRAAEVRAGEPYGLDVVVAWPRLYPLLSDPVRAVVDGQRDALDVNARFCAVFAAAAVISVALLVTHGPWLLVPAGCLVLAWLAYRAAVSAATAYGESIRAAVDLHRFTLLEALHLPLPATPEAERALNAGLSRFLLQGVPLDAPYEHGVTE